MTLSLRSVNSEVFLPLVSRCTIASVVIVSYVNPPRDGVRGISRFNPLEASVRGTWVLGVVTLSSCLPGAEVSANYPIVTNYHPQDSLPQHFLPKWPHTHSNEKSYKYTHTKYQPEIQENYVSKPPVWNKVTFVSESCIRLWHMQGFDYPRPDMTWLEEVMLQTCAVYIQQCILI